MTIIEPDDRDKPDLTSVNLIKDLVVTTYPGFHLPHVWLAKNGQSHRVSILDLCGRGEFTLITGIGGGQWREWADELLQLRPGLAVRVFSIGWRQDYMDAYGDWDRVRGVDDEGAVLVRPDHFVAWRCRSLPAKGQLKLTAIFDAIIPPA